MFARTWQAFPVDSADHVYTAEELEFLRAIDRFKREKRRPFPSWSEALTVLRSLGWCKAAPAETSYPAPARPEAGMAAVGA